MGYGHPSQYDRRINTYGGSIYFDNATNSSISIPATTANNIVTTYNITGAFTIEWFQYMLADTSPTVRIFTAGNAYPYESIAVELKQGQDASGNYINTNSRDFLFIYGRTSTTNSILSLDLDRDYINKWIHIAISRDSAFNIRLYMNGVLVNTVNNSTTFALNASGTIKPLTLGGAALTAYITNFRWTIGSSIYSSSGFIVPRSPLTAVTNTQLLLNASLPSLAFDDSAANNIILENTKTAAWNSKNPFIEYF